MLQRWLASVLLYSEKQFNRVMGYKEIDVVLTNIDHEFNAEIQFEKVGMAA